MAHPPQSQSLDSSSTSSLSLLPDPQFVEDVADRIQHGETTRELSRLVDTVLKRHMGTLQPLQLGPHSIDVSRLLRAMVDCSKLSGGTRYVASAIIIADQRG